MIGAPDPGVVDDGVVAVDFEIDYGATDSGASDAEEYIVEGDGIFCVSGMAFGWTYLKQDRRRRWAGIEEEASDEIPSSSAVVMAAVPLTGCSVANLRPITTALERVTRIGSVSS